MNISNSLTSVFVFNVFPPKLLPSKKFLGLFSLVLQQPCQCLERFHPGKPCGCQVVGHEICGVPNKHCTFCRSLVTHVSHQNKTKKRQAGLAGEEFGQLQPCTGTKRYIAQFLWYSIPWTRNGPTLFRGSTTMYFDPTISIPADVALTLTWL